MLRQAKLIIFTMAKTDKLSFGAPDDIAKTKLEC